MISPSLDGGSLLVVFVSVVKKVLALFLKHSPLVQDLLEDLLLRKLLAFHRFQVLRDQELPQLVLLHSFPQSQLSELSLNLHYSIQNLGVGDGLGLAEDLLALNQVRVNVLFHVSLIETLRSNILQVLVDCLDLVLLGSDFFLEDCEEVPVLLDRFKDEIFLLDSHLLPVEVS